MGLNMLRRYRVEPTTIKPIVTMGANEKWVEFTVRYIVDYKRRQITNDAIFSRILPAIRILAAKSRLRPIPLA